MEPNTVESMRRTCFRVQKTSDCGEDLRSNRTMTPSIQLKQHWNDFRTRTWKFLSGPAKAQTWIVFRICGKTSRLLFTNAPHPTWQGLRKSPNPGMQNWWTYPRQEAHSVERIPAPCNAWYIIRTYRAQYIFEISCYVSFLSPISQWWRITF